MSKKETKKQRNKESKNQRKHNRYMSFQILKSKKNEESVFSIFAMIIMYALYGQPPNIIPAKPDLVFVEGGSFLIGVMMMMPTQMSSPCIGLLSVHSPSVSTRYLLVSIGLFVQKRTGGCRIRHPRAGGAIIQWWK
jgi:hypothetical protein